MAAAKDWKRSRRDASAAEIELVRASRVKGVNIILGVPNLVVRDDGDGRSRILWLLL